MRAMHPDDLVELQRFGHVHEAELAVSTLEAAGIDAVLKDSTYGGIRPETSLVGGGVGVMVRRRELAEASQVLQSAAEAAPEEEGGLTCASCGRPLQGSVCPDCNDEDYEPVLDRRRTRANVGMLKGAVLIGTLILIFVPVAWERFSELDAGAVKTALYIVLGLAAAVAVLKFLFSGSDQRL